MRVRPREDADKEAARTFLARHDHTRGARLGQLFDPLDHPALLAEEDAGQRLGRLIYVPQRAGEQGEVLPLHVSEQWPGAGTALIEAVKQLAAQPRCARLWVITTNDNVDALRFYQ